MDWLNPETRQFLQATAPQRRRFRGRYRYYHHDTVVFSQRFVEPDEATLMVGCDVVELADEIGVGKIFVLELDPGAEPASGDPRVERVRSLAEAFQKASIRWVILPYTLQMIDDIQQFLTTLHALAGPQTRVVILQYNFFWAPVLKLAQKCRLRSPLPDLNWLNISDIDNLLTVSNYQTVTASGRCLIPFNIPLLTTLVNRYVAPLPFFQWLCQKHYVIARPLKSDSRLAEAGVSVIVPARNEQGNIQRLLDELPALGPRCEVVFVEGHSRDDTWGEIQRQIASHPRRSHFKLQAFQQEGEGKADAVRLGFSRATGDIFMILDADLSVQPEDLRHFHQGMLNGTAEFLNGSRLVYKMERHAMQVLNLFFNKVFADWVSWLIGQNIKDSLCGTKTLFRRDYERIRKNPVGFGRMDPFGDFELLFGSGYLNLKICDVPVRYKQRTYGSTNIRRFKNGWDLLRVCWSSWRYLKK